MLVSVAEVGSIGGAARVHGMSQPAASARIRDFEKRVGAPLLQRGSRGAVLTEFGVLVCSWAEPVLRAAAELATATASLHIERAGQLRIAASLTVAEYLLPRWLVQMHTRHPQLAPTLVSGNSAFVAEQVTTGQVQVGFVESPEIPPETTGREVARDHLILVVASGHRWVTQPPTLAELAGTALVSREPGSGTRSAYEHALAESAPTTDRAAPMLELSSTTAIKSAVENGGGAAVLSSLAVETELARGSLHAVTVPGLHITRSLSAIWPTGAEPTAHAADLILTALSGPAAPIHPTRQHLGPAIPPPA